jgi:hypothetical protein
MRLKQKEFPAVFLLSYDGTTAVSQNCYSESVLGRRATGMKIPSLENYEQRAVTKAGPAA